MSARKSRKIKKQSKWFYGAHSHKSHELSIIIITITYLYVSSSYVCLQTSALRA